MKTIYRNLLALIKRFKLAIVLNIVGLSVAFASFTLLMMQVSYEWGFDKFHQDKERIFRLARVYSEDEAGVLSPRPLIDAFISSSPHIEEGALIRGYFRNLEFSVEKEGLLNYYIEKETEIYASFTRIFNFDMWRGESESIEKPDHILIPKSMALKIYGDENVIGKQFVLENEILTIGGVYKDFPLNSVIQNVIYRAFPAGQDVSAWRNMNYQLFVKLDRPESAQLVIDNFKNTFTHEMINWEHLDLRLTNVQNIYYEKDAQFDSLETKGSKSTVLALFTIGILIILIAGINFTNFSNAVIPMRMKNINTQKVLGGTNLTLQFSLFSEAVMICLFSFLLSLVWVHSLSKTWIGFMIKGDISLFSHLPLIGITFLAACLVGIFATFYPARYITSFSPAVVLKGSFGLSPKGKKLRGGMVGVQFVASFALIIAALFVFMQNRYMLHSALGFKKDDIAVVKMNNHLTNSNELVRDKLLASPYIKEVTFAEVLFSGSDFYSGWEAHSGEKSIEFQSLVVDYHFMDMLDIYPLEGRLPHIEDSHTAGGVFFFNESAQKLYGLNTGDKVEFNVKRENIQAEVAGIIPDVKFRSFRNEMGPMALYVAGKDFNPYFSYAYIQVNPDADKFENQQYISQTLQNIDPNYTVEITYYDTILNNLYSHEINLGMLISLFSLMAVFISIVGVLGLVIFDGLYRKKEICLRKIHGATTTAILLMFNKSYVYMLTFCFVLGTPLAYAGIVNWLQNFAYKTPMYWWVFALSFIVVTGITLLAVNLQNWKTANENPVNSIRVE